MEASKKSALMNVLSHLILFISIISRYYGLKFTNTGDFAGFVLRWYKFLTVYGFSGFQYNYSNYTPPYHYLLYLATLTSPYLTKYVSTKLIGSIFDLYAALIVGLIVFHRYRRSDMAFLASSLFFALPTIVLNSAYWGQADGIYTAFLLTSILFAIKRRPFWAMIFFGVAFAFKLQAIFMLPFLVVMAGRKNMPWGYFLLIPAVYIVMVLPAAIAGRSMLDLLTIYFDQSTATDHWSLNAPSIFAFVPATVSYFTWDKIFLIIDAALVAVWVGASIIKNRMENLSQLTLMALASVTLLPFILPHMHERYFYASDAISLVVAFYVPMLWFLPILFQTSSYLVYSNYLFIEVQNDAQRLQYATIINFVALAIILLYQFRYLPKQKFVAENDQ